MPTSCSPAVRKRPSTRSAWPVSPRRARSTLSFNDQPEKASRPYDKDRDGFVMGEGAGVVVLEEYEHAKARGAKIYAEVVGYGLSGDAYHVTAPHPEGRGRRAGDADGAAARPGMEPEDIDYVNAHGTSTMADTIELAAVKRVLGDDLGGASMSSTKSAIGHLLGGAGAVESDLLHSRDPRPDRPTDAQPRRSRRGHRRRRPGPAQGQEAPGQRRAQQQLRLWRDQRQPRHEGRHIVRRRLICGGALGLAALALIYSVGAPARQASRRP